MMTSRAYVGGLILLALAAPATARSTVTEHQSAGRISAEHPIQLACDLAYSIATKTPGTSIQRDTGVFTHEAFENPIRGCRLVVTGLVDHSLPGEDVAVRLRDGFAAQDWQEMIAYSADGKDGTAFALRKAEIACLFRGVWSGGLDGQSSIRGAQAYTISVLCSSPAPPGERVRQ